MKPRGFLASLEFINIAHQKAFCKKKFKKKAQESFTWAFMNYLKGGRLFHITPFPILLP
jgi:hypothetical protein